MTISSDTTGKLSIVDTILFIIRKVLNDCNPVSYAERVLLLNALFHSEDKVRLRSFNPRLTVVAPDKSEGPCLPLEPTDETAVIINVKDCQLSYF